MLQSPRSATNGGVLMGYDLGIESLDDGFANLVSKASSLIPIMQNYMFDDLVSAIYAITSWRDNRSAQESCLALNRALIQCSTFGSEKIGAYVELSAFFDKIEPTLKIKHFDDSVLNDFGEVQLCFNKQFYPVITGTGHTGSVYAALQYLESLSIELDCITETEAVLTYTKTMVDCLKATNVSMQEQSTIVFEKPTKEHFLATKRYIDADPTIKLNQALVQMFLFPKQPIVKTHFINKEHKIYPLFNPSLALDYYTELLNGATPQNVVNHIHSALFKRIKEIHLSSSEKVRGFLLYKPKVAVQNKPISILEPTFLYLQGNSAVIFHDVSSMGKHEIDEYLGQLSEFHSQNKLGFVDLSRPVSKEQFLGFDIPKEQSLVFIPFNRFTNLNATYMHFGAKGDRLTLTALDLMFILSDADDMDEIIRFFDYHSQEQAQVLSWSGIADSFSLWKQEQGYISKGAHIYNMIYFELETSATYMYSQFVQWRDCFPFRLTDIQMGIPEQWNIILDDNSVFQFGKKGMNPQGGAGFLLGNTGFLFLSYDFFKIQEAQNTQDVRMWRDLISGLNERFVIEYESELERVVSLNKKYVNIHCNSLNTVHEDGHYVNIDCFCADEHTIKLHYTVDCRKLIDDIEKCENRKIESEYLLQLFSPIYEKYLGEFQIIVDGIIGASAQPKTINTKAQAIDYYLNTDFLPLRLRDESLLAARKTIAIVASQNDIVPGKYERKNATKVVRTMQETLVNHFEKVVQEFDRLCLHVMLLHYYASELTSNYINQEGYALVDAVDISMQQKNKEKLISAINANKEMQISLRYLIETNLFLDEKRGAKTPNTSDIENMVAFSHWLWVLQSNSDMCFHTISDTKFVVLDDYRVDVELGEEYQTLINHIETRTYESGRYGIRGDDKDKEYFDQVAEGFFKDTGVDFRTLDVVLRQLMVSNFPKEKVNCDEIRPNVIRINKEDVVRDIQNFVVDPISDEMVRKAYDFITLSPSKLKSIGDTQHNTLPVWEREKRNERFDVKPLLLIGDSYIFSPVVIKEIHSRWMNGWLQFYPPYEIGLTNALDALWKWKEHYEHLFSSDICDVFQKKGYVFAKADVDIRRYDRKGNHPSINTLGDYDVIALNNDRKRVFIIECKVLQPVGSIFEHSMQQKRFFLEEKYDEKFQRRVDYFKSVYRTFFENVDCGLSDNEYSIESFMVVSKVFESYYKKVEFPIVTFDELMKLIE